MWKKLVCIAATVIVIICGVLLYNKYTTQISATAMSNINFSNLRQYSQELLINGFDDTDTLRGADFVYADYYSDCFIWLDSSAVSAEMPITVAIAYSKISSRDRIINQGTADEKNWRTKNGH